MSKTAVILAGGKGTRLRPYTAVLPKPLMPIGDYPIVEVIVRQLAAAGFGRILMAVNHQADIIKSYFNSGAKWGVHIDYSLEKTALGTMGPLKLMESGLPEHFLVLNGDILTDLDFAAFHQRHVAANRFFTISSYKREQRCEFGVLKLNGSDRLTGFVEKPVQEYDVSMGVYMLSKEVLEHIPPETPFGFDDLMYALLQKGSPVSVLRHQGIWLDIGRPDDYMQAIDLFEEKKNRFINGNAL